MSEQAPEAGAPPAENPDAVDLPPQGDAAFMALMDVLAPEPETPAGGEAGGEGAPAGDGAAAPAGGGGGGQQPAAAGQAGQAAPAGGEPAGAPAAGGAEGAAGGDVEQPAAAAGAGALPAAWTQPSTELIPKISQLATTFEENVTKAHQETALADVRKEHERYFQALEQHPRLLVGQQVPAIGKDGMETIRDTQDAKEWQDAVKSVLIEEVRDRAGRALEDQREYLETVHNSIKLFQDNADLIPGSKDFDVELANRFAEFAKPYELRIDGKLNGYAIPVQPLIEQIRTQLLAERKTAGAAPSAPAAAGAPASTPGAPAAPAGSAATSPAAEPPQAGITSKAGAGGEAEDYSTLFGTIGLPGLRI